MIYEAVSDVIPKSYICKTNKKTQIQWWAEKTGDGDAALISWAPG